MQNGGSGAEAADRAFLSSVERPSPQPSEVVLNQVMSSLNAGYNGGMEGVDALSYYRVVLSTVWRGRSKSGDYNCAWDKINVWKKEGNLSRGFPPYDSVEDQKTIVTIKEREEKINQKKSEGLDSVQSDQEPWSAQPTVATAPSCYQWPVSIRTSRTRESWRCRASRKPSWDHSVISGAAPTCYQWHGIISHEQDLRALEVLSIKRALL